MSAAMGSIHRAQTLRGLRPHSAGPFSSVRTSTVACEWPVLKYALAQCNLVFGAVFLDVVSLTLNV